MNKTIKTIIIISIILAIAVTSITALAEITEIINDKIISNEYDELIEDITETQIEVEETDSFNKMLLALEQNIDKSGNEDEEYEDYYNSVLYNYFYLKKVHGLSQSELDYISDLIANGCDAYTILDITYFWLDTSESINLIEKMYNLKDMYEGMDRWYEYAFYRATGYENELSDEDYNFFAENGIDEETMRLADRIARKRVYTTKEILNKMVDGESLAEITYNIEMQKNRKVKNMKLKAGKGKKFIDDKNIIKSKRLADLTGKYENALSEMPEDVLNQKLEEAEKAVKKSVLNTIKNKKLMKNDPDRQNEKVFKEKIKAKGVSEEEIEKLVQQGYKYVDILNATEVKNTNNLTIEETIEEMAVNE